MKLKSIHHIAIIAKDYAESKQFYTEVLGFEIIQEVYREARDSYKLDLALGGLYQIELFSFPDYRPRGSYPESLGLRHLAFAVDNVEEWIIYLRSKGVESVQDVRVDEFTGRKFTFFNDPNGQPLELYEN
ncbi:glyoxylase I family protein [Filimonas zeae]|uniref:VOC family protein n=1 Tax=Filimonas zeae TaxID=1737353 RepID=A0A917IP53_9BACT|nr:VOC family protein [Filimonas zeae]MDR6337520.1 glyoxylase I family protein [Filimonas zeae]GGH59005.1 VOC family protein [Filimonas zeae]